MASRQLSDLHPKLQEKAPVLLSRAKAQGIDVLIYCTHRPDKEQAEEYAKGRTKRGRITTKAKPGESPHNFMNKGKPAAMAFDCVPVKNGKALWDDAKSYAAIGKIGEDLGLVWGGRWKMRDKPHFELPEWQAILEEIQRSREQTK